MIAQNAEDLQALVIKIKKQSEKNETKVIYKEDPTNDNRYHNVNYLTLKILKWWLGEDS